MGVKLMTGATGEQNIQAADDRECLAGITGLDSYVFPTGNQLKATLVDANTVTIGTGAGSLQGSRFRCSTTTTVNIQSGTQGQFRHDIIGLHFSRETSGREGLEFQVLTGEPAASEGAAADPAYTAGDLLKGDAEAFMPLYRVKLSGINAADPEPMFSVLTPLATLGDSVSPLKYIRPCEVKLICTADNQFGIQVTDKATGNAGFITIKADNKIHAARQIDGVWGAERILQHSVSRDSEKLDKIKLHNGNGKEVNFFSWDSNVQITVEGTGHRFSILFDASGISLKDETTGKWVFQKHQYSVSRIKIASGGAHIYGCDVTLDVSYIPAIQSLVFETKGSGYMTTGTEAGNSFKALTLPSDYRPSNERAVCILANLQLKFGVALRFQTNGDAMLDVSASVPMRAFAWPSATGFIPLQHSVSHAVVTAPANGVTCVSIGRIVIVQLKNISLTGHTGRTVCKLPFKPVTEVIGCLNVDSASGYVKIDTNGAVFCFSTTSGNFSGQAVICA